MSVLHGRSIYGDRCIVGNNDRWLPILTKAGVYGYPSSRQKTVSREVAQSGSASGLGPEGRRFESCLPDHLKEYDEDFYDIILSSSNYTTLNNKNAQVP